MRLVPGHILIFPESVCEGSFVKIICRTTSSSHLHICTSTFAHLHLCSSSHLHIYISAHLHIFTSTFAYLHLCSSSHLQITSLLIFTSAHLHLCSSSHLHIYTSAHLHICVSCRSSFLSLLRPGAGPPEHHEAQPSAEIVRVEGAKFR